MRSRITPLSRRMCRAIIAAGFELPGGEEGYAIERCYAGHWQRSMGAWSWRLRAVDSRDMTDIGSQFPATWLLKGGIQIYHGPAGKEVLPAEGRAGQ